MASCPSASRESTTRVSEFLQYGQFTKRSSLRQISVRSPSDPRQMNSVDDQTIPDSGHLLPTLSTPCPQPYPQPYPQNLVATFRLPHHIWCYQCFVAIFIGRRTGEETGPIYCSQRTGFRPMSPYGQRSRLP